MSEQEYDTYINIIELDRETIDGHIKIKTGTTFWVDENKYIFTYIGIKKYRVCWITSQNAFEYFAYNTDGNGYLRKDLLNSIYELLKNVDKETILQPLYNNNVAIKYCKYSQNQEEWIWDMYLLNTAPISDLESIMSILNTCNAANSK